MTHRNYAEDAGDFNRLARFIMDNNAYVRGFSTWCVGRLVDWKYSLFENKTAVPNFTGRNAHLWFDGFGTLAGFVISENGGAEMAILTLPGYRFLFADMLHWGLENWGHRGPTMSIEVTARQALEIKVLEAAGFGRKFEFYTQAFDLTEPPAQPFPLAEGFRIVDMATHPDFRAQRILRDDAFEGREETSDAAMQRRMLFYNNNHNGPIYHPEADLCVMAADGRFVSGCEALIDAHNAEADIERVCTHSQFRRRGLARAVIQACLLRLYEMGMCRAYITGYSEAAIALYRSMGAGEAAKSFGYETAVG